MYILCIYVQIAYVYILYACFYNSMFLYDFSKRLLLFVSLHIPSFTLLSHPYLNLTLPVPLSPLTLSATVFYFPSLEPHYSHRPLVIYSHKWAFQRKDTHLMIQSQQPQMRKKQKEYMKVRVNGEGIQEELEGREWEDGFG